MNNDTCWYTEECADEMNNFYDKFVNNPEVNQHLEVFSRLLDRVDLKGERILDVGCGTASLSRYCAQYQYFGADLPHIIAKCAMRNHPQFLYRGCDFIKDDLAWMKEYPVVVINGVLDISEDPVYLLNKVLNACSKYLIIHRQEISRNKETHTIKNPSYNSFTYHSIINKKEFEEIIEFNNFDIIEDAQLPFSNWENGGNSFLLRKRKTWALNELDYKLNKVFKGKQNGYFIEAGANDGLLQSNTYYLEHYKNWDGILIEAIDEQFAKLIENRSPRTLNINFALVGSEDTKTIKINYTPDCAGLMSSVNDIGGQRMEKRTVTARTLNSLLEQFANYLPSQIDLLVLDLEGYESEALKGIDFDRWNIEYLLIEEKETSVAEQIEKWYAPVDKLSEQDTLYKRK